MTPSFTPPLRFQSNGRYHVTITASGGGYGRCNGVALTRWHASAGELGGGKEAVQQFAPVFATQDPGVGAAQFGFDPAHVLAAARRLLDRHGRGGSA